MVNILDDDLTIVEIVYAPDGTGPYRKQAAVKRLADFERMAACPGNAHPVACPTTELDGTARIGCTRRTRFAFCAVRSRSILSSCGRSSP